MVLTLTLALVPCARAAMLCKTRSGTVKLRDTCRRKEATIQLAELGLAPIAAASRRSDSAGKTSVVGVETNVVDVQAPVSGSLLIVGSTRLANHGPEGVYALSPRVDGRHAVGVGRRIPSNSDTVLAYTTAASVTAGSHTVSQEIEPPNGADFFYDSYNLSVLFVPGGSVRDAP